MELTSYRSTKSCTARVPRTHQFKFNNLFNEHFPCYFLRFLQNLPAKYKWRPQKSYYLRAGPRHWAIWQIRRWLFHYVHEKFRWGSEVATIRTKTNGFSLVIRLNWLEKIELRGCTGPPGRQYYLFVVRVYVLLYAKMLKESENQETRLFLSNLCHWWHSDWGGPAPLGHPPSYAYDFEIRSCP